MFDWYSLPIDLSAALVVEYAGLAVLVARTEPLVNHRSSLGDP